MSTIDFPTESRRVIPVAALSLLFVMTTVATRGQNQFVTARLPAGEQESTQRWNHTHEGVDDMATYRVKIVADVMPVEVEFVLTTGEYDQTGSYRWKHWMRVGDDVEIQNTRDSTEPLVYRELLLRETTFTVLVGVRHDIDTPTHWESGLVVHIRRVNHCSMWARLSGDVSLTTFGDVAYFNALDKPTARATGSIGDPAMQEMMGDLIDGMSEAKEMMEGNDADPGSGEGGSTARKKWEDFMSESGEEAFGLTLIDQKTDVDASPLAGLMEAMSAVYPGGRRSRQHQIQSQQGDHRRAPNPDASDSGRTREGVR